jgi:hypothetical protein
MSKERLAALTGDPYFELAFQPSVALTSLVRRFVSEFYAHVLRDPDLVARLALATHELLENTIKYSVDGESVLRVAIERASGVVTVHTSNRSDTGHIDSLRGRFAEMNAAADPFAFYQTLLRRTAHEKNGSGLGLARIRYEGEMDLALEVEGPDVGVTHSDTFAAWLDRDDDVLTVHLEGDANMAATTPIGEALNRAHEDAMGHHASQVVVDFRVLEFMSSACFKKFVTWLDAVQQLPSQGQYRVRFLSNPTFHWQRRSLHALQCFALDLVSIET